MKSTVVKSLILMLMIAALATLIIIPTGLSADTVIPGKKVDYFGVDACRCPDLTINCACIMKPPVD